MLVYSFLTPGDYGNVVWKLTTKAWFNIFLDRDIFDNTLRLADAHLTIFWRSVKLSLLTTAITFVGRLPDRLVHRDAAAQGARRCGSS